MKTLFTKSLVLVFAFVSMSVYAIEFPTYQSSSSTPKVWIEEPVESVPSVKAPSRALGDECPSPYATEHYYINGVCAFCGAVQGGAHEHSFDSNGVCSCGAHVNVGTGDATIDEEKMIPVGSAVLPLLLMLMGYVLLLHRRRKQEVCE